MSKANDPKIPAPVAESRAVALFEAESLVIHDEVSQNRAEEILTACGDVENKIHEILDPFVKAAKSAHTAAVALRKEHLKDIESAKGAIKGKLRAYLNRLAAEAEERRKETAAALDVSVEDIPDAAPAAISSASVRETWDWEVEDGSKIPAEFFILDEKAITAKVKKEKGECQIPGIKVTRGYNPVKRRS